MLVEIFSTILLISDRLAYLYRGDVSRTGYFMVRISNFLLFFMVPAIVYALNMYIADLMMNEGGFREVPISLKYSRILMLAAVSFPVHRALLHL